METTDTPITLHHNETQTQILSFISWLATVTTIGVGLTGLAICRKIRQKGSVGDISPAPFVAGLMNAMLWVKYGFLVDDHTILLVNWVNGILNTTYVSYYYCYATSKLLMYKYLFSAGCVVIPCYVFSAVSTDVEYVKELMGYISSIAAIGFCAAPLTQVRVVIQSKSTESMSFVMALATFFMGVEWFVYGYLINDSFVIVPNFLGALLGATQLYLFYKFPGGRAKTKQTALPLPL